MENKNTNIEYDYSTYPLNNNMEIQLNIEMTPQDYAYTLYIKFNKSTYFALFHITEIKKILIQERIFETEHYYHQVEIELKKIQ